jgi:hypothetical protein
VAFAGDREIVDVEDREIGPAGLEQLERVRARRRRLHVEVDALALVVGPGDRAVDTGVDSVRGEVEGERDVLALGCPNVAGTAAGERQRRGGDERDHRG